MATGGVEISLPSLAIGIRPFQLTFTIPLHSAICIYHRACLE